MNYRSAACLGDLSTLSSGAQQFLNDLASTSARKSAMTGSFAASRLVSATATEIAVICADDPERIATLARLRSVSICGNVVTVEPYDQIVFERTWTRDNIVYTSPAQFIVDRLSSPGRMPAEG